MPPGLIPAAKKYGFMRVPPFLSQIRAPGIVRVVIVLEEAKERNHIPLYPLGAIAAALLQNPAFAGLRHVCVHVLDYSRESDKGAMLSVIDEAFQAFIETGKLYVQVVDK